MFLENGHAQGALEHRSDFGVRVVGFFQAVPAAQVGVHHVALDRAGAHDRHFHHQVVELARPQARQHVHLGAGFHLEHAQAVALAEHVVGGLVAGGDVLHGQRAAPVALHQVQGFADRGEHAQGQHVHLHQAQGFQVVLVPLDQGAVGHRRVFHRHQSVHRVAGDHEAAHVLGQVTREAHQLLHQFPVVAAQGGAAQAHFPEPFHQGVGLVPPGQVAAQPFDDVHVHAQGAAHVAHRRAGAVVNHGGGQSGAVTAVFAVEVLHHFFAAFVLEVHVDVRRLVPLLGDKALKQKLAAARVHLGDAQAVAHRGVGRRAAPLAEDALATGEGDDVVHGEEVVRVAELADQPQLLVHQGAHPVRYAVRVAGFGALVGEGGEIVVGVLARRHHFFRVLVADFVHFEVALLGDPGGFFQQRRRVDPGQPVQAAQVALVVLEPSPAQVAHRGVQAQGGEQLLQALALRPVVVDVVGGGHGQPEAVRQLIAVAVVQGVVAVLEQLAGQPQALAEVRLEQGGVVFVAVVAGGQPQAQGVAVDARQVLPVQPVVALLRAPPAAGDQRGNFTVGLTVAGQQHQTQLAPVLVQAEVAAHDQPEIQRAAFVLQGFFEVLAGLVGTHHPGQGAVVGDRQGAVALAPGLQHQLLRLAGAGEKGEGGGAMQFREVHVRKSPAATSAPGRPRTPSSKARPGGGRRGSGARPGRARAG